MQLDIFAFADTSKEKQRSTVQSTPDKPLTESTTNVSTTSTSEELVAYEEGDGVKLIFPTDDTDPELSIYLEHYYSHIKGKKGKVLKVLPYKKLQYLIEFDVKHEDTQLILYHHDLEWYGK